MNFEFQLMRLRSSPSERCYYLYMRFQIKGFHSRFPSDDLNPNGIDLNCVLGIISHIQKFAVVILGQSPGSEAFSSLPGFRC